MAEVFGEPVGALSDRYLEALLGRKEFWAFAALRDDGIAGGLTAHTLPMTRAEASEILVYDIAVHADHQRKGIGRQLVGDLRDCARSAGIHDLFVPVDNEDEHALDFYRALGGTACGVTIFTFQEREAPA